jgi:molybdate/tungstate transport system substrate-binding protein
VGFRPSERRLIFAHAIAQPDVTRLFSRLRVPFTSGALALTTACGAGGAAAVARDTVVVYVAASLAQPVRAVADSFTRRTQAVVLLESGGSLEHARKVTELQRVPDLMVLADHEVFPQLLMPTHVQYYLQFARNRMVIAYTARSRFSSEMSAASWRDVLGRRGVEVGRPDPERAPAGYRTLIVLKLAEAHYRDPGLAARVLARSPPRNMRGNAAELAGLLALGELDYIFEYESLARSHGFRYVTLPREVDLGDPALAERYATASVRVTGRTPRDSVTFAGAPILYGLAVPRQAPHGAAAWRFAEFLLGPGKAQLRAANVDVLDRPRYVPPIVVPATAAPARP